MVIIKWTYTYKILKQIEFAVFLVCFTLQTDCWDTYVIIEYIYMYIDDDDDISINIVAIVKNTH